ncbi:MAG: O-antigen ligase family protein [Parasporobacterium sp.]|nr:O-antigen ligase family protein [Parasporobacterium sp.]
MVMSRAEKISHVFRQLLNIWSYGALLAVLLVIPLFVENNYFNIVQAKEHCLHFIVMIMVPLGIILDAVYRIAAKNTKFRFRTVGIIAAGFSGVMLVSCLLSENPKAAFLGNNGWGMGAMSWLGLTVICLIASEYMIFNRKIYLPIMGVHAVIILIGILHSAGLDVLYMHERMYESQVYAYISTIGQMNWWVGYLCLFVPAVFVFVLDAEDKPTFLYSGGFWILLSAAMIICSSDGLYLGLGIGAFFLIPFAVKNAVRLRRAGMLTALFGAVELLISVLPCFAKMISMINPGLARQFTKPWVGAVMIALGTVVHIAGLTIWTKVSLRIKRIFTTVPEVLLGAVAAGYLITAVLSFSDKWGTRRGLIWRMSMELFDSFSLKDKLIGIGPEMLREPYTALSDTFGKTVLVSHSEPLQYLLTSGIIGTLFWLGIWAAVIYHYIKSSRKNCRPFFAALMAYMGQSLVNSGNCLTIPLFFAVLTFFIICTDKQSG